MCAIILYTFVYNQGEINTLIHNYSIHIVVAKSIYLFLVDILNQVY